MQPYYEAARALARRLTEWRLEGGRRFLICTGAGPGIMEAANRGAAEGGGRTVGFAINLPGDQEPSNPYVTPDLHFEFHYFFVRKFWFIYNAKALLVFPGGYGTMDELMEVLTLVQTGKVTKKMGIVLYGADFWNEVINFDALLRHGVINPEDRELFVIVDSVDEAFDRVRQFLTANYGPQPAGGKRPADVGHGQRRPGATALRGTAPRPPESRACSARARCARPWAPSRAGRAAAPPRNARRRPLQHLRLTAAHHQRRAIDRAHAVQGDGPALAHGAASWRTRRRAACGRTWR